MSLEMSQAPEQAPAKEPAKAPAPATVDDPVKKQLRQELLQLNAQREKIEREIKELQGVLKANNVGMSEELVDDKGFPRNDIDVYQVRTARHKIICLQNDAKAIMKQIEEKLFQFHDKK